MSKSAIGLGAPSQLTLVALYQQKPVLLADLITRCQEVSSEILGGHFRPYDVSQVHATVVGMERVPLPGINDLFLNRNAHVLYDRRLEMNFSLLIPSVESHIPMNIRWGGYEPGDTPFTGKSVVPFRRSIYFNRSTGKLVLIGWPHRNGDFSSPLLLHLRNELERACGFVHKYRNDNDLFQVLGSLDVAGTTVRNIEPSIQRVETELANLVSSTRLDVEIGNDTIQVACYKHTTLPTETTRAISLENLTAARLMSLYGILPTGSE